ncbi:MAG: uncharacterized protein PWQ20_573 [Thermotogaceae bacterium]|jgi:hypothetical protein|nr:uncharacterized protein [Thermotogaceae bacterium]MDN5337503.1 uncharacterized protein [Thermotogaceae bacterium]
MKLKFFADRMLGKLAKKLRILGFDTLYFSDISEDEILKLCKAEDRTLLTRDRIMFIKATKEGIESFFLKSDRWYSQLKAVKNKFKLSFEKSSLFERCIECNCVLEYVEKEKIKNRVPEYVYLTNNQFLECPKCHKIYWRGTHVENILKDLNKIFEG